MTDKTEDTTHADHVAEVNANKLDIINGRMPLAVVFIIRFLEDPENKDNALAKKYHTSPGKISDVRKCRNFTYVDENFKPSAAEVELALKWADKMDARGAVAEAEELGEMINTLVVATPEESEAMAVARKATRKPRGKKAGAEAEVEAEELDEGNEEDDDLFD